MTIRYEIKPNEASLSEAMALLEWYGIHTEDAVRIAINKTAPRVRTMASREIRNQVRLQASYVNSRMSVIRASRGQLTGGISTPSRGMLLSRFSTDTSIADDARTWDRAPAVPPRGIRVKVKPSGSVKVVRGGSGTKGQPFYMRLPGGNLGIVARRQFPGPEGGRIDVLYGPSLSQVFDSVRDDVLPAATEEYERQLIDAMRYLAVKRLPPEAE